MVGVLGTARNLAFVPISLSLAYIVRGGRVTRYHVLLRKLLFPCVCVCVCVVLGVGRFNNRTYIEFLRSWNATRKMKTKIGPAEVSSPSHCGGRVKVVSTVCVYCRRG